MCCWFNWYLYWWSYNEEVIYVQMCAIIMGEHGCAVALLWLRHVPNYSLAIGPRQKFTLDQGSFCGATDSPAMNMLHIHSMLTGHWLTWIKVWFWIEILGGKVEWGPIQPPWPWTCCVSAAVPTACWFTWINVWFWMGILFGEVEKGPPIQPPQPWTCCMTAAC